MNIRETISLEQLKKKTKTKTKTKTKQNKTKKQQQQQQQLLKTCLFNCAYNS